MELVIVTAGLNRVMDLSEWNTQWRLIISHTWLVSSNIMIGNF